MAATIGLLSVLIFNSLRKENAELKRANAILKDASVYFAQELDPTRRR